jgi:catechol 2,3-dioxygenase-like lactoylglutathione lyase family enzyme
MTTATAPQLDLVGIVVRDMARSLAFYRELGVDLPSEADRQPMSR